LALILLSDFNLIKMKKYLILLFTVIPLMYLYSQNDREKENRKINEKCFTCHGQSTYQFYNPEAARDVKYRMNPYRIIYSDRYYMSVHKSFKCTDCHSEDYDSFPHPSTLRFEIHYQCIDCHGGDETYAKFNFEKIEEEFLSSIHSTNHSDEFSCWMCHSPHYYSLSARKESNTKNIVAYSNSICLNCHSNIDNYQLISNERNSDLISKHDWLPNQQAHFNSVRCIDCHAEMNEDVLVAHKIKSKNDAVKNCIECHSQNSKLLESLYRYDIKERTSKYGFYNARILNETFIIGANRNYLLNILSVVMASGILLLILFHLFFRIIKKTK